MDIPVPLNKNESNPNPQTLPSLKLTFSHLKMDGGRQRFFWFRPIFRGELSVLARGDSIKDLDWYHLRPVFGQVCKRYLQRLTLQHLLATIPHKLSTPITNPTRPWVSYSKLTISRLAFWGSNQGLTTHSNVTLSDQHVSPTTLGNIRYIIYLPTTPYTLN